MSVSNPPSSPQDTPIKDRIMIFMGDNLHVVLEDEGDQAVISTEQFAQDLANQLNQLITRSIDDTFNEFGQSFRNLTLHSDGRWTIQWRENGNKHLITGKTPSQALANLKESLNE